MLNPLPKQYLTDGPGVKGRIKERPEDFLVDEQPLYEPCGEGEHLYLGIEKVRVSHGELISTLSRHFRVKPGAIGFAGMKDKHGITRQTISVHVLGDWPTVELGHERIKVLWVKRHRNKIRRGHLAGNRFSIRIRGIDATLAPQVLRTVRELERLGVPAYFGHQRFGYRRNNHLIGAAVMREDWKAALDELLGLGSSWYPEYQQERRELYDRGEYAAAVRFWTPADRAELIAIKALHKGKQPYEACVGVGQTTFNFWLSSLQSAVFNRVLDMRLEHGSLAALREGDLAWRHDGRRVFAVTRDDLDDPELHRRLEAIEISPSGPLWGSSMIETGGAIGKIEETALHEAGLRRSDFKERSLAPKGGRRPLRAPLRHPEVDGGIDEHGHYVRVAFDLPRGIYATVAMREIMKNDAEW
ncbi:MAG: tRNA pseudouridine(13) synthase TruD [Planctomycetota bacterium]|jgi:tRNA pseudouridine13 synthase